MSINRLKLLAQLNLVKPAVASQEFVPAWTHILLESGFATAYNDTSLISVKTELTQDSEDDFVGCAPADLLIKALNSFAGENLQIDEFADHIVLKSGKSKVKLPTLAAEDFKVPTLKGKATVVPVDDEHLAGIKACLFNVGTDPTHPSQMGVTLGEVNGKAVFYSTDNITISRYSTNAAIKLPEGGDIILPTFFCEQLLSLARYYSEEEIDLEVYAGALQVTFGRKAKLLTKTLVDLDPLEFESIIGKFVDVRKLGKLDAVPSGFDNAFKRSLLVLGAEKDKSVKVTVGETIELEARGGAAEVNDVIEWEGDSRMKADSFHVDPALVARAGGMVGRVAFYDRALVLASEDGKFVHLVSHMTI